MGYGGLTGKFLFCRVKKRNYKSKEEAENPMKSRQNKISYMKKIIILIIVMIGLTAFGLYLGYSFWTSLAAGVIIPLIILAASVINRG